MTPQITARHVQGRDGQPLAIIDGFPGLQAEMTPDDLMQMSRMLRQIAIDGQSGQKGERKYPEDGQ